MTPHVCSASQLHDRLLLILSDLKAGMRAAARTLKELLTTGGWRTFLADDGKRAFASFDLYATSPAPSGLGLTLDEVRAIARLDPACEMLFNQETASATGVHKDSRDNVPAARQGGNSREAADRRLMRERPDLAARVAAGEISRHAACVQAGWRRASLQLESGMPVDAAFGRLLKAGSGDGGQDRLQWVTDLARYMAVWMFGEDDVRRLEGQYDAGVGQSCHPGGGDGSIGPDSTECLEDQSRTVAHQQPPEADARGPKAEVREPLVKQPPSGSWNADAGSTPARASRKSRA